MPDTDAERIRELVAAKRKQASDMHKLIQNIINDGRSIPEWSECDCGTCRSLGIDMPRFCDAVEGIVDRLDERTALLSERQQSAMTASQIFAHMNRSTDAEAMLADIRHILEDGK